MSGFSLLLYALSALGLLAIVQSILIGLIVLATVLFFMKRS